MDEHTSVLATSPGFDSLRRVQQNRYGAFDSDLFENEGTDDFTLSSFKPIQDSSTSTQDATYFDSIEEDTLRYHDHDDGESDEVLSVLSDNDAEEDVISGLKDPSDLLHEMKPSRLVGKENVTTRDAVQSHPLDPSFIVGGSNRSQQSTIDTIIEEELPTEKYPELYPLHDADTSEDRLFYEEGIVDKITNEEDHLDKIADSDSSEVKQWDSEVLFDVDTTERRQLLSSERLCEQTTSEDRRDNNFDFVDYLSSVDPSKIIDVDSCDYIMCDNETTEDKSVAYFDLVDKDSSELREVSFDVDQQEEESRVYPSEGH